MSGVMMFISRYACRRVSLAFPSTSFAAAKPGVVVREPERIPTAMAPSTLVNFVIAAHERAAVPIMTIPRRTYDFALRRRLEKNFGPAMNPTLVTKQSRPRS